MTLKKNSTLRGEASAALAGKWVAAALVTLVAEVIYLFFMGFMKDRDHILVIAIGGLLLFLVNLLVGWGYCMVFYDVYKGERPKLGTLFAGFKDFNRIVGTSALVCIYVWLWSLLLIVPGFIKGYSYAMTPFILRDCPGLAYNAAIEKSMAMMNGNKMKLFLLDLSFIGWWLLCLLTLGIGFLFLLPYMCTSRAAFYEDLKAAAEA